MLNTAKMTYIKMSLFSYERSATQDMELNEEKLVTAFENLIYLTANA